MRGHAGVGKTRLILAAQKRARESRMAVLAARCVEIEREFPFGALLQLFQPQLERASPTRRAKLLSGAARLAAPIFEVTPEEPEGDDHHGNGFPVLHGLFWLSSRLAAESPLLITVDDLQWADPESARFLHYLGQRLDDLPVAVVVAVRTGSGEDRPDPGLELAAAPAAELVEVGELSEEAVGELVRRRMPDATPRFSAACAEATHGNPFLVGELIGELLVEGIPPTDDAAPRVGRLAPDAVSRMALLRLVRLGPGAIALARAATVLGEEAKLRHAATLADLDPRAASEAADALVAANLVETGERLTFIHPLIRSAIYESFPPNSRARLHRRAAQLQAADQAAPERIAIHLLHVHHDNDPWVVQRLREAARAAVAGGAPETAVAYLHRALEEPPAAQVQPTIILELGRAEALAGVPTAREHLVRALELADPGPDQAEIRLDLGRTEYAHGRIAEAAATFERGANEAMNVDDELAKRLGAEYCLAALYEPELRSEVPSRLGPMLERVGDPPTLADRELLAAAAMTAVMVGEPRQRALELVERALGGEELFRVEPSATSLYSISGTLWLCAELAAGERILADALSAASHQGSIMGFALGSQCRAYVRLLDGRLPDAIADAEAAIDARRYGWEQFLPTAYAILIQCLVHRGEVDAARSRLADLDSDLWSAHPAWVEMLRARGTLAMAEGRTEEALEDFLEWGRRWSPPNPAFFSEWRSHAAEAAARLGDSGRAVELAQEEVELVRRFDSPRSTGVALRALGLAQGGDEGLASLRAAVESLERSEARLDLCRALVDEGAALRRANHRSESREPLRRALDLAERLSAGALGDQAAEELRLAGGRPRRRSMTGVESLTPGELRVARLAAQGLTNREIAERLFVTVKAVQWHLRHTYQKLDVTRDELPKALADPP